MSNFSGANLNNANLSGSCLESALGFIQTDYSGTPILEECANADEGSESGDFSFEDMNEDGYDDVSFDEGYNAGATSGDFNFDGILNVVDVIELVNKILND